MTIAPNAQAETPIVVNFDDNRLLAALFGEHDRHLARIEQQLGVSLATRGNRIAINGDALAADTARACLVDLYERLKRGLEVQSGDVDGALRMAQAQDLAGSTKRATTTDQATMVRTQKRVVTPRSPLQAAYVQALRERELVFGLGPAGTGKTYLAVAVAAALLIEGAVERIILTRPAVEAGERLGFLPGGLDDKIDPYMRPLYDALYDMMPGDKVIRRRDAGDIEVAPLAYMRGRTLSNAFIILDEAQNTTPMQMKMFLTRMGENSRMAVTGDISQVDLPLGSKSGLVDALEILGELHGIQVIEFGPADVVRHPMVTRVVRAYEGRDHKLLSEN